MAKGLFILWETVVPGIKIKKTRTDQLENRMNYLERNDIQTLAD